ncbi:diguanylate cyclase [Burkholderia sp. WP9]|uniref:diguanylate cyclase domain-containing protein n=1 Tax=Burkholderia sp. WP9 TaxID=1500263 RepID=UPI00256FF2E7|nr:diguanylate cyclase [Burkholderia sp. WP9]
MSGERQRIFETLCSAFAARTAVVAGCASGGQYAGTECWQFGGPSQNRRALDEVLENQWRRLQRSDGFQSLLFVDVDNFKRYNDRALSR